MLSNQEILTATVEFINSTAASISDEELRTYQHENPNDILTDEIIKTVKERMNSELMLRMSNFMAGANVETRDDLSSRIKEWFSAGEEFYYVEWEGFNITPTIKEVVKSFSKSDYSHKEFYKTLKEFYNQHRLEEAMESQGFDYPSDKSSHTFVSVGTNGFGVGKIY